ncbi:PDZ domain-containing protein [Cytobacillus sp. Sa5YUA1]|uniref:PDZ domain-containing protein n=1 Tax=Cytobacillus stercorigallinarum TaxID=2762240 RepID=A0ABR8QNG9_9BACI|nr:PDZ domain-containing protein [Cytobacillus stercorigallinarum]MBD7937075.1 PDZ domain-containing protein [Cytobacillus stercorigallinarum]
MAEAWAIELLKGLGRLFLNPVFYLVFLAAAYYGIQRVNRERQHFLVRAENAYFELKQLLPLGLILGVSLSLIIVIAGLTVPVELLVFATAATIILMLTPKARWATPAYTVSIGFILTFFALEQNWPLPAFISSQVEGAVYFLPAVAIIIALLVVAEGIMITINGPKGTSPRLMKSRRGQIVGMHEAKRMWLLPLFLLIPGDALSLDATWWPLFSIGDQSYALVAVPFAIGFQQQIQSKFPAIAVAAYGKKVIFFGALLLFIASGAFVYPIVSLAIPVLAIVGREWLNYRQRSVDAKAAFYFAKKNEGLMIIGVVPHSPADKMGLKVGETVLKVNGLQVNDEKGFYQALQKNAAHCKLEVIDINNENRFVQRALYKTDHHELGILFIKDEFKKNHQAV